MLALDWRKARQGVRAVLQAQPCARRRSPLCVGVGERPARTCRSDGNAHMRQPAVRESRTPEGRNVFRQQPGQVPQGSQPGQPNATGRAAENVECREVAGDARDWDVVSGDRSSVRHDRINNLAQPEHLTLDERNAELARERVGMFLEVT